MEIQAITVASPGSAHLIPVNPEPEIAPVSIQNEVLSYEAFCQISGSLAGYPFVKIVIDRPNSSIHFLNNARYAFHGDYIAENILGMSIDEFDNHIDVYNKSFYEDPKRRFLLGIVAFHQRDTEKFFTLETVEVDTMDLSLLKEFYQFSKTHLDPSLPLLLKPANHLQEGYLASVDLLEIPRIYMHELLASATFVPLNPGKSEGRIRVFKTEEEYQRNRQTLEWFDIIVMPRVPDDIPRLSGVINAAHTTPLSHTNILTAGWQVPNSTQIGVIDQIESEGLDQQWVEYSVENNATKINLKKIVRPASTEQAPSWNATKIKLDEPEIRNVPIVLLERLRMSDQFRYGTKAANLGELNHVLTKGSERLLGFYRIRRPPRPNLLPYLAQSLGLRDSNNLANEVSAFLRKFLHLPRGIAIPFSVQQQFFESSPKIQQAIGKLKMALELNARQFESLCIDLQRLILNTRIPESIRDYIDGQISEHLGGVSSFVVRSSSNAEDLEGFSAAGIYESVNHVTSANKIFESIKKVWASVLSPRSVRLRHEVGISLDDVYMGVIVQEQIDSEMGGVLVTTNPASRGDFRNVYLNLSLNSVVHVVQGTELPYQYLFNTVEGGGRTLALGSGRQDLSEEKKSVLQKLSICGRLLQSHFSPNYMFNTPVDIEWLINENGVYILQLRPYSK